MRGGIPDHSSCLHTDVKIGFFQDIWREKSTTVVWKGSATFFKVVVIIQQRISKDIRQLKECTV